MNVQEMARLGGKARAEQMTKDQRSESARKAVQARWARVKEEKKKAEKKAEKKAIAARKK